MKRYKSLYEAYKIIGYHQTDYARDILENGFDLSKINVAFLGAGFSFSTEPFNDMNKKNILKVEIKFKNPLSDYEIWRENTNNLNMTNLLKASKELTSRLRKLGYDGILAFRKYGWWENSPNRDDEIIVFNPKNIKNISIYR